MKYLGINLAKCVQYPCNEKYKTLFTEIKGGLDNEYTILMDGKTHYY